MMTRTTKIISEKNTTASPSDRGTQGRQSGPPQGQTFAAGIDTSTFAADTQEVGGERFWEAFWKTLRTYGGVSEGQALADVLELLDDTVFARLHQDVQSIVNNPSGISTEKAHDILGMVNFLLRMERADPRYDPFDGEGYAEAMRRFAAVADAERQRRAG